jgi:hypothetical protein
LNLLASKNFEKKLKKYLKNIENLKIDLLMQHGNLPEAIGFKELDHTQYELERFDQLISIS